MNVQDPFNLSHNTTQNVNDFIYEKWVLSINAALELCTNPAFQVPSPFQPWGVLALCADIEAQAKAERASLHPSQWNFYIDIHMRNKEPCLEDISDPTQKYTAWCNKISKVFVHVLSKILKVEFHHLESDVPDILSHVDGAQNEKEMKAKSEKKKEEFPDPSKPLVFAYCSSLYMLWQGRKQALKELSPENAKGDSFELEEKVTEVLSQKKELKNKFPMLFEVAVLPKYKGNAMSASLRFLPHGSEALFINFFTFFNVFIYHQITKNLGSV